jgi:hypothetical protein
MPVKKTKLGMTVEAPKKPSPYDALAEKMKQGEKEQQELERQGGRKLTRTGFEEEIVRSQAKIPKAKPSGGKKSDTKA